MLGEPVDDFGAVLDEPQILRRRGSSSVTPASSRICRIRSRRLARYSGSKNPAPKASTATRLPWALSSCDALEQQILAIGGQVGQQPLCRPCGRLAGIESRITQRLWPVVPKIDGHRDVAGRGFGATARAASRS